MGADCGDYKITPKKIKDVQRRSHWHKGYLSDNKSHYHDGHDEMFYSTCYKKKKTKENLDALTAALTPPPADDHRKKAVVQYGSSCRTGD